MRLALNSLLRGHGQTLRLFENVILLHGASRRLEVGRDGARPELRESKRLPRIVRLSEGGEIFIAIVLEKVQTVLLLKYARLPFAFFQHFLKGLHEYLRCQLLGVPNALQAEVLVHFDHEYELASIEEGCVGKDELASLYEVTRGQQALHQPSEGHLETADIFELFLRIHYLKPVFQVFWHFFELLASWRYLGVVVGLVLQNLLHSCGHTVDLLVRPEYSLVFADGAAAFAWELSVGVAHSPNSFGFICFGIKWQFWLSSPE